MKRLILIGLMALVVVPVVTAAVPPWRYVKTVRANSLNSTVDFNVKVTKFNALAVKATGKVTANAFGWVCVKHGVVFSQTRQVDKPGLFVLPNVRGSSSCQVNASIVGSGPISLSLLRR